MAEQEKILELEAELKVTKEKYAEIQIAAFNVLNLFRIQEVQGVLKSNRNLEVMALDFTYTLCLQRHDLEQNLIKEAGKEFADKVLGLWKNFLDANEIEAKKLKREPATIEGTLKPDATPQPKPPKS